MNLVAEYYFELNALFAVVFLLMSAVMAAVRLLRLEPAPGVQLSHLRAALVVIVLLPLFVMLADMAGKKLQGRVGIPVIDAVTDSILPVFMNMGRELTGQVSLFGIDMEPMAFLTMLLAAGMVMSAVSSARKWLSLRKLVASAVTLRHFQHVDILISDTVSSPFSTRALGRNQIVLPYGLVPSPSNLRIAIRHELQHLRNGDLHWVLLLEVLRVMCFWNPFVRLWHNTFDCLQEYACDASLVDKPSMGRKEYGNCLLAVATAADRRRVFASSFMVPGYNLFGSHEHALKKRIRRLETIKKGDSTLMKKTLFTGITATVLGLSLAGTIGNDLQAQDSNREESNEFLPVKTVPPRYPFSAIQSEIEGWVRTRFTVYETGEVVSAEVVESCAWKKGESSEECIAEWDGLFNESSLVALNQFMFDARQAGGESVSTEGVEYVFRYRLAE